MASSPQASPSLAGSVRRVTWCPISDGVYCPVATAGPPSGSSLRNSRKRRPRLSRIGGNERTSRREPMLHGGPACCSRVCSCSRVCRPNERRTKGGSMQREMSFRRGLGVLAAVLMLAGVAPAYAQTQGMDRRDDRRDNRAGGRAAKQACKAGDEKTRAECRQVKRDTKHGTNQAPAPKPEQ